MKIALLEQIFDRFVQVGEVDVETETPFIKVPVKDTPTVALGAPLGTPPATTKEKRYMVLAPETKIYPGIAILIHEQ